MPGCVEDALACPNCGGVRFLTFAPPFGVSSQVRCATCGHTTTLGELSCPGLPASANAAPLKPGHESGGLFDERGKLQRR